MIASPVGSYFKGGPAPVSIWVSRNYTRAAVGGTGAAKCGGNYAASLRAQSEAIDHGCDQVVFLDAIERRYIEELGGMNVFFVFDDGSLLTPPLGTILPGITRDSIMALSKDAGTRVREELYTIDQWRADAATGRLKEAFACGTAAVISPIGRVRSASGDFVINGGVAGPVATGLRKQLIDIQYGRAPDPHGWVRKVRERHERRVLLPLPLLRGGSGVGESHEHSVPGPPTPALPRKRGRGGKQARLPHRAGAGTNAPDGRQTQKTAKTPSAPAARACRSRPCRDRGDARDGRENPRGL